ncbi:hypothetical protein HB904_04630 [Listeria booriae]|uniref:Uncharacterized protein n=1 Tax=Listeria booriae TaxID=1552123 RepID=A0A842AHB7_9LIST|nr:hypothetical protein [Listeria booriae]MBC1615458.1 hypothetical protein [Listeria booriae]
MIAKTYSDDEYYTSEETAISFFEKVVLPSGILSHKTILMPFTVEGTPLHDVGKRYHDNIVSFDGNKSMWQAVERYEDVAVIDNPPFSLSAEIERTYIDKKIPFILFRSAVSYPKFILRADRAGVVYENSKAGVEFNWGFASHISDDEHIKQHYPNLLDMLSHHGILRKKVPVGFSFNLVDYNFKIKSVTFDTITYPNKKDVYIYLNHGVFDERSDLYISEKDGRVHATSH